jgi:hypothetical protein
MPKSNRRTPPVFYVGVLALVLVLFSTHMTGGLYARYTSYAEGSDSARVAKFDVAYEQDTAVPMSIVLDFFDLTKRTDTVKFWVTSSSEVAVKYYVIVTLPNSLPMEWLENGLMNIQLDGKDRTSMNVTERTVTFAFDTNSFGTTGEREKEHELTFSLKENAIPGMIVNITESATLRIHVEQID